LSAARAADSGEPLDKNSLTADRTIPGNAYAIWDRLMFPNERSKGRSFENAAAYGESDAVEGP
jgi:hypothetical protein